MTENINEAMYKKCKISTMLIIMSIRHHYLMNLIVRQLGPIVTLKTTDTKDFTSKLPNDQIN